VTPAGPPPGYSPDEIADRLAITDVLHRYAWAIDDKDWAGLDEVFTPDAWLDYSSNPGGFAGPYAEARAWLESVMQYFPTTQHLMSNSSIELAGDRATAKTMVHNPQGARTRDAHLHMFFVGARYDDELVRVEAGWRISKRVETLLWMHGGLPKELLGPDDV
jgi:3-phenylpropionate/cinnamic acid dioxygenase small subunit